jgi:methyltransferase (TIGR00027 family)
MHQLPQWDIVSGVGLTALGVAVCRAIETHRRLDRLVSDPYAAAFVHAAPLPLPTWLDVDAAPGSPWELMVPYFAVRSKFFDEFVTGACAEGLDQVVLLAAGLDSRAFRLDWPPMTTLYELDAPKVLTFKNQVLIDQGARTHCVHRAVAVDLRDDWALALLEAGFDPSRRTVWLAEGLLPFLSDEARVRLFSQVHQLSLAGSRVAADHVRGDMVALRQEIRQLSQQMVQWMAQQTELDLAGSLSAESATELWCAKQNYDPTQWLAAHGWDTVMNPAPKVAQSYRRPLNNATPLLYRSGVFITAQAR